MQKLFHEEVYIPEDFLTQVQKLQLSCKTVKLSRHLQEQVNDKYDRKHFMSVDALMSKILNLKEKQVSPFEVEATSEGGKWRVTKYVVRVPFDATRDVTIVVSASRDPYTGVLDTTQAFIKTAWLNHKEDTHKTLDITKYQTTL